MGSYVFRIVSGLIAFLVGLALLPRVIDSAVGAGTSTGIGSFGGVEGVNDLLPLIFVIGILVIGLGAMISGVVKRRQE